jgi:hypothetical protein
MKNEFNDILGILLIVLITAGCRREIELANWDTDVLIPLAFGDINFSDYTPNENVNSDANNLLHLTAEERLLSIGLDTLIGIPDYSIDTGFVVPISLTFPPGVPFFFELEETKFDLEDVELTYALIRESEITIFLENTIDKPVLFQYGIYSATLDGDTFLVEARVEANYTLNRSFTLDGYELDLRGENGTEFNTVVTFLQAMIHPDETQNHQFKAGDRFNISNTVSGVIPEYVSGYFGNQSILFEEDEAIDVFDQFPFRSLNITDFDLSLTIDNGIGADLRLNVQQLGSINTGSGSSANLSHNIIGRDQLFARAINTYDLNDPVKYVHQQISFTDENSNLDQLFELRPDRIRADIEIEVNPLGDISLGNDFAYYDHNLTAVMKLDVPLLVAAKGVRLVDTSDFEFNPPEPDNPLDRINYGSLNLILDNGYPIDAEIQIYLLDSFSNSLDSLLAEPALVMGAEENLLGQVEMPVRSIIEIPLNQSLFVELEIAKYLRVDANLNTVGIDSVHLKSNSQIAYKLVADLNARTKK